VAGPVGVAGPVPVPGPFGPAPVTGPVTGAVLPLIVLPGAVPGVLEVCAGTLGAYTVAGCCELSEVSVDFAWSIVEGCSPTVGVTAPGAFPTRPESRPPPSVTSGSRASGAEGSEGPRAVDWPITGPSVGW
jgi:hypothetical protein